MLYIAKSIHGTYNVNSDESSPLTVAALSRCSSWGIE